MVLAIIPSCLSLSQKPSHSFGLPKKKSFGEHERSVKRNCIKRPQIVPSRNYAEAAGLRVFIISDLHAEYYENMKWVKELSNTRHKKDVLLVAGDVAETYHNFVLTMSLLTDKFEYVFYVPGNHDLWCRREAEDSLDSLDKLNNLLDACKRLGVQTSPMSIDSLGIIPLFSWYHESFDKEEDITEVFIPSLEMACKDFHTCKWPDELSHRDTSLALYFDAMNEKNKDLIKEIQGECSPIITFSHFLPRQELCPEKRMLFYPNLPKIIGSDFLEVRLRSIHGTEGSASACHVFGHTHFCWDSTLDGIRYVQAPLAYPRERKRRMNGGEDWLPYCIYSDGKFADKLMPCYWSEYYSINPRTPHNTQLAPWVSRFYKRSEFTFLFVLKACAKLPSLGDLKKLHSHTLLTGFQSHVLVQTALIDAYSKCRCLRSARLVFDEMPLRSLVSWNSIISAHCRDFHIDQSFAILSRMQLLGLELRPTTFLGFLPVCSLPQGLSIHCYITKLGLDDDLPLANSIMSMYIRLNQIDGALSIFDSLLQKSIVSWTIILGGYLSSGDAAKVFTVFNQMRRQCVVPDSVVFVNILSCCKLSGNLLLSMSVHSLLLKSGFHQKDPIDNLVTAMYVDCKDLVSARWVFDDADEKNVFLWTSMISGYAQLGHPREALHLFNMMLRTASKPNEPTLAAVLSACAEMGSLRTGEEIEQYIFLNDLGSDLRVQTSLIHMFCKCGSIKKAQAVFERIPRKDLAVWSAMINGYAMHGMGKEALNLFNQMQNEERIKPDSVVFTSVLLACSHSGMVEDGLKYFRSMEREFGIEPSIEHYSCLVDLLGRAGYVELAMKTIEKMPAQVQARVSAPVLSACFKHQNLELGEMAAKKLFKLKKARSSGNFVLMNNMYTSMGKWREAEKARRLIDGKGLVKEPGWSQIEIDAVV